MWYLIVHLFVFSLVPCVLHYSYRSHSLSNSSNFNSTLKWSIPLILSILTYSLIIGFAYNTGEDYTLYYEYYVSSVRGQFDDWGERREIGFQYLVKSLSSISESPALFFILCSLLNNYAWVKVSSLFGKASWFVMFMLYIILYPLSMNLYRQYMAIAFLLIAFSLLMKRELSFNMKGWDIKIILLLIALAFFFHTSSIAGLVMYFLGYCCRNANINKILLICIVLLTTILSDTLLVSAFEQLNLIVETFQAVSNKGYGFEEMVDTQWDESRMKYVLMIIHIVYIWYADKVLKANSQSRFILYLMVFYFILLPISMQEIMLRIRTYLSPFMAIGIALTLYFNVNQKYKKVSIPYPLLLASIVDFSYILFNLYNLGELFPLKYLD